MVHMIVDGPIEILKCITPGCYWVQCAGCSGTSRIPESIEHKPFWGEFFPPQGASVFVHDSDGFFYRGTICGQRENLDYTVQLTDTFQVKDFKLHQIYPSYGEDCADCQSAHLVSLQNSLPAVPPDGFDIFKQDASVEIKCFENKVRGWDMLNEVVDSALDNGCDPRFEWTSSINGSTYGRILYYDESVRDEVSLSGIIRFLKIAATVKNQFEKTILSLQSYALYRGFKFLPHVYPYGPSISIPKAKSIPFGNLIVHKDDLDIYTEMIKKGMFVQMLTHPPRDKDTVIRFLTPDGLIVLAAVAYATLHYCEVSKDLITDEMRAMKMLQKYIKQKVGPFNNSNFAPFCNFTFSDFSDSEPNDKIDISRDELLYDFDVALRKFKDEGGIVKFFPKTATPQNFKLSPSLKRFISEIGALEIENLLPWQKVVLPSLASKKNVTIIGPRASKKLTTSLACVLASMLPPEERSSKISPQLIVFVYDFHRADHVARLCLSLSKELKIISLTTFIFSATQQKEAIGCDVIVTTLDNWTKLTDCDVGFDISRVEFVVFDGFEKLCADHLLILDKVADCISKLNNIQTIALLNHFTPDCARYLTNVSCVCTTDILSSFSAQLKPNVVFVSDDWDNQLARISSDGVKGKKLLLCSNSSQVAAIECKLRLENMLYVHEKLSKAEITNAIDLWQSDESKFLVCSDMVFDGIKFARNVDILVSWDCSLRETLIKRLQSISDHRFKLDALVSLYLFCDRNCLDSLLFIKHALSSFKVASFVNGDLNDLIKASLEIKERNSTNSKCCPDVLTFGSCYTDNCEFKHKIDSDIISVQGASCFLKIKSIKFRTAFHMTARVEEIVSDISSAEQPLRILKSRLPCIDEGLSKSYEIADGPVDNLKIGRVVGAKLVQDDEICLRRAKILNFVNDKRSAIVEFLDFDIPDETLAIGELFAIPRITQTFPRDLVHIHLSGLKPSNPNLDWCYETTSVVKIFVKLFQSRCKGMNLFWIVGPVKASIGRQLVVDSVHICQEDSDIFVAKTSLKQMILDNALVVESQSLLLNQLPADVSRLGRRAVLPGGFNMASVSSLEDPGLFYVTLNEECDSFIELENRFNTAMECDSCKLSIVVLDELCAVKKDNVWNRASIVRIQDCQGNNDALVTVMYVDYGDTDVVPVSTLFSLPSEFEDVPFNAIECGLAGVQPSSEKWDKSAIEIFKSRVWNSDGSMINIAVKFCSVAEESPTPHFRRYLAIVMEPGASEKSLNCWLVNEGIAHWDNSTVKFLFQNTSDSMASSSSSLSGELICRKTRRLILSCPCRSLSPLRASSGQQELFTAK